MALWAILPVKPFASAKLRLAPVLRPAERRMLALSLFRRTLGIVGQFAVLSDAVVVSRSREVLALARALGAIPLKETGAPGLNVALARAARFARSHGATRLLILPSDLPFLDREDLRALASADCAIAPDRRGEGTNALVWPTLPHPVFHFGANSFLRHRLAARSYGLAPCLIRRRGLSCDIDTPADFAQANRFRSSGSTFSA
jgi:2-phospho-L-lactate guanylyltransferase